MAWPDVIADPAGDLMRENKRMCKRVTIWRGLAFLMLYLLLLTWVLLIIAERTGRLKIF